LECCREAQKACPARPVCVVEGHEVHHRIAYLVLCVCVCVCVCVCEGGHLKCCRQAHEAVAVLRFSLLSYISITRTHIQGQIGVKTAPFRSLKEQAAGISESAPPFCLLPPLRCHTYF